MCCGKLLRITHGPARAAAAVAAIDQLKVQPGLFGYQHMTPRRQQQQECMVLWVFMPAGVQSGVCVPVKAVHIWGPAAPVLKGQRAAGFPAGQKQYSIRGMCGSSALSTTWRISACGVAACGGPAWQTPSSAAALHPGSLMLCHGMCFGHLCW
jgi:hypothetical protein